MRRPIAEEDDLLRPSLDQADDPARMRKLWSPWQLALFACLGGPLAAGYLYGENFRRMRRPTHSSACVLGALGIVILSVPAVKALLDAGFFEGDERREMRLVRYTTRALTMLAILPAALLQQRPFRVFTASGGEPGPLLGLGLTALFVGGFVGNLLVYLGLRWTT